MAKDWQYQIRFRLGDALAETARTRPDAAELAAIRKALAPHNALARSQYDAFAGYVAEAEQNGVEDYPLYKWTKATIEDPVKKAKHAASFAVLVDGAEVYDKEVADAVEADLRPLFEQGVILALTRHDTNPANNPQMPEHFR